MQLMPVGISSWDRPRFYPSVATTLVVWGYSITSRPNYCSGASSHHLFTSQYYSNLNFSIIWEVILFFNFNLTYINVKKLTLNWFDFIVIILVHYSILWSLNTYWCIIAFIISKFQTSTKNKHILKLQNKYHNNNS